MAYSSLAKTSSSKSVCRYFLMSKCMKGDNCRYAHSSSSKSENLIPKMHSDAAQGCDNGVSFNLDQESDLEKSQNSAEVQCRDLDSAASGGRTIAMSCDTFTNASSGATENSWNPLESYANDGEPNERGLSAGVLKPEDWVMAAEFIPGQIWQPRGLPDSVDPDPSVTLPSEIKTLVPSAGEEVYNEGYNELPKVPAELSTDCVYPSQDLCIVSGELCELCQGVILTTLTEEERQKHVTECIDNHEKEMERSFAIQRSLEKMCGICMDVVWEKAVISEQRFGILSNCNHVFCLSCIRKWRAAKQFENKIVRACPECRVKSDFVTPSHYWVEDKDDKKKLIEEYKLALSKKPCKYFDKGRGECPFNEKCFYLHALPDGRVASPKPVYRRRRPPTTSFSQTESTTSHMVLYEILEGWPLDRWEDLIFHLNFFELSLPSTSDEEEDDADDDFDDSYLSGVM